MHLSESDTVVARADMRQADVERREPWSGFNGYLSSELQYVFSYKRKPQTASLLVSICNALERVENPVLMLRRDAHSIVSYAQVEPVLVSPSRHGHRSR